ncbi:MAG: carotenoid biosynthesis protein [Candidatus Nanoarchaeia archaeon]
MKPQNLLKLLGIVFAVIVLLTVLTISSVKTNPGFETIPTLIPEWIIGDLILLIISGVAIYFILKNEKKPLVILLELVCFTFLYAAVYENFATMAGYYNYGKALIMILNIPLSIPLIEYVIIYASLRLTNYMKIPTWIKPFIVGISGMIFDFTLDPVAIKQVFNTKEGILGRWTWFITSNDANIYGEPVYNFTGWYWFCLIAAAAILIGRYFYKKSKYNTKYVIYPIISMIVALITLVSPISRLFLWLEPFFTKGSIAEWIMLGVHLITPIILLLIFWKGKMNSKISLKKEYLLPILFIIIHLINIITAIIGKYYEIIWLQLLTGTFHTLMLLIPYYLSKNSPTLTTSRTEKKNTRELKK